MGGRRRVSLAGKRALLATVLLALVGAVSACNETEDIKASCTKARDHLIELRLADASGVDRDAHRAAMKHALGDSFVSSCQRSMSSAQVRCVLSAKNSAAATACVAARDQK